MKKIELEDDEFEEIKTLITRTKNKIGWVLENREPKNKKQLEERFNLLNKIEEKLKC